MTIRDDEAWTTEGRFRVTAIQAQAKLNLGLRVVGRRADGYHLLESLFVPLDLADDVTLRIDPARPARVRFQLRKGPPNLEADERNLAARAAQNFLAAANLAADIRIELTKRIPVGAGMGGGSSDAGAVLRGLAAGHPGAVSPDRLAELAVALGADVPYFLDPRPAWVHGIGEAIEPIPGFPALPVIVATPRPPLDTAAVFRAWDHRQPVDAAAESTALTPEGPGRSMPSPRTTANGIGSPEGRELEVWWRRLLAEDLLANDLESIAAGLHAGIARLRSEIERSGAQAVGMSGSGPTVFGVFGAAEEARAAAARISWEPTDHVHVGSTTGSPERFP